jgi:hypothetical protein
MSSEQLVVVREREWRSEGVGIGRADGEKLELRLRNKGETLETEWRAAGLPTDGDAIVNFMVGKDVGLDENKYWLALAYSKLKKGKHGKYWERYGCKSEYEFLICVLGLPVDGTLQGWLSLAELVPFVTFKAMGTSLLLEMAQNVDRELRRYGLTGEKLRAQKKEDYRTIFKGYKSKYGEYALNKQDFREVVDSLLENKYPMVEPSAKRKARRSRSKPVAVPASESQVAPVQTIDLESEDVICSGCQERDETIEAQARRIKQLERYITKTLKAELPPEQSAARAA